MRLGVFFHESGRKRVNLFARLNPRHQLGIMEANQVRSLVFADDFIRYFFFRLVIRRQFSLYHLSFRLQISFHQIFSHDKRHRLSRVRIIRLDSHIVKLRPHTQSRIRGQRPWRSGPSQEIGLAPFCPLFFRILNQELRCYRSIFHVTVTTRLIQLMRTQACARRWRIRLNGITLIQQTFVIELPQ